VNPSVFLAGVFALLLILSAGVLFPVRRPLQGRRAHRREVCAWCAGCLFGIPSAWILAMVFSGAAWGFLPAVGII